MVPHPKADADPVATATMERIRRSLNERSPQRQGLQWGAVVCALFVGYLGANVAGNRWNQKPSEPVAAARHEVVATATPSPYHFNYRNSKPRDLASAAADDPAIIADFNRNKEWFRQHPYPAVVEVEQDHTAPRPVGDYFDVVMPDGRQIHATVRAAVESMGGLPSTHNQIGDARYVTNNDHWYIWTALTGETNAVVTWVDP